MLPIALAVASGLMTTLTGVGGGIMLMLGLSLVWDPITALAVTAPALGAGNLHRWWLFRQATDRAVFFRFASGALPGALLGALVAARLPQALLFTLMAVVALLGAARSLGWLRWAPSPRWIAPSGAVIGVVAASGGGPGLLTSPVMMAAGLHGASYLATAAACAVTMHAGRLVGYAVGGLVRVDTLLWAAALAAGIFVGNLVGKRVRGSMSEAMTRRVEAGSLLLAVALAIGGVTR